MKSLALSFALVLIAGLCVPPADAGEIYSIGYTDIASGTTTDLTTAGSLDWVKWGNGETSSPYSEPYMTGGTIINPTLTPVGSVPAGQTVDLVPFAPIQNVTPLFSWSNGTAPMAGGNPVGTIVSETITPAQFSYPLGLGASFTVTAGASPLLVDLYVQGFDTRMEVTATLSGGGSESLVASNAALIPVASTGGDNYYSYGFFSIDFAAPGETLTITLTADNQSGIPTDAPQYGFANAGVMAATVSLGTASVPEPSSLLLSMIGIAGLLSYKLARWKGTLNTSAA